ncbi:permease C29B12,14c [Ceratobasidium sp. AG-Ba]|nr:permease C29B12,14c [Ceratobasidium sp. AG-Ba]QRW15060.1 permease C29B12,14c [Ceratobasidium sp. AG-Ba]
MSQPQYPESVKVQIDEPPPKSTEGVTAEELLRDYLNKAISKQKYQYRLSKVIAWSLNFLIILQVIVSALVTVVTSLDPTPRTRIASVVLGALSTVTAALVARAKGTNQPELAENYSKDLQKFIGRCQLFIRRSGSDVSEDVQQGIMRLVEQFEAIEDKAVQANRGREVQAVNTFMAGSTPATTPTPLPGQHTGLQPGNQTRQ